MSDGKEVKRTIKGLLLEMKLSPTSEERILAEENILQMFDDHDRTVAELKQKVSALGQRNDPDVGYRDTVNNKLQETIAELRAEVGRLKSKSPDLEKIISDAENRTRTLVEQVSKLKDDNIAELRAEVERYKMSQIVNAIKGGHDYGDALDEIANLKQTIARQARVIEKARKALNEYRCSSCLNRDELNCYRYEACSSYKELAAIEKEGE